jgi:hypothetical protein
MGPRPCPSSNLPGDASAGLPVALTASIVFGEPAGEFAADDAGAELVVIALRDPIRPVEPSGECPATLRDLPGSRRCTLPLSSPSCHLMLLKIPESL